ncbi:MAG TPA: FHA domain-containing protein [Chthoniobacteraceae bacterium]|jgi:pSer/pThr/pTyr-binding forkhead associated (FHA) protein|nr:FHA domain-containing protein [Chthoniobacteraceae bacterium]
MPKLIVTMPDGSNASHDLTEDVVTIGRVSDNVIQIEDASVSSHHAEIKFADGHHILTDLESTNGTRVNGNSFTGGQLCDGDKVRFGKIDARYTSENPEDARPLPETEAVAAAVGESSARPQDFANASPFKSKSRKKDPISTAILSFAGVAVLVFIGAVVLIFRLQPPH